MSPAIESTIDRRAIISSNIADARELTLPDLQSSNDYKITEMLRHIMHDAANEQVPVAAFNSAI